MLTAGESSSVHTCLPCPNTPQNPAFTLPDMTSAPTYPRIGTLWSRAGSALMDLSHRSPDLDNVFCISIKGKMRFLAFFSSSV